MSDTAVYFIATVFCTMASTDNLATTCNTLFAMIETWAADDAVHERRV